MTKVSELLKRMSVMGAATSALEVWTQLRMLATEFGASSLFVVRREETSEGADFAFVYSDPERSADFPEMITAAVRDPAFASAVDEAQSKTLSELAFSQDGALARLLNAMADGGDAFIVPVGNEENGAGLVGFAGRSLALSPLSKAVLVLAAFAAVPRAFGLDAAPQGKRPPGSLTDRETECLRWLSVGKSDSEIAIILGISPRTVRFHIDNAKVKLGAATRIQAVAKALREQAIAA